MNRFKSGIIAFLSVLVLITASGLTGCTKYAKEQDLKQLQEVKAAAEAAQKDLAAKRAELDRLEKELADKRAELERVNKIKEEVLQKTGN